MHLFVNGAVTAAEAEVPDESYFDKVAEWRALRERFLAAARSDLDLPASAWPADDPTSPTQSPAVAANYGISRRSVHELVRRFDAEGSQDSRPLGAPVEGPADA